MRTMFEYNQRAVEMDVWARLYLDGAFKMPNQLPNLKRSPKVGEDVVVYQGYQRTVRTVITMPINSTYGYEVETDRWQVGLPTNEGGLKIVMVQPELGQQPTSTEFRWTIVGDKA